MIRAHAASAAGAPLQPFEYEPDPLAADQVEVAVTSCGICHSDLSMLDNEWGMTAYPLVPGHEVIGKVTAVGDRVTNVAVGQTVGVGWFSGSCQTCTQCLGGDHNLCDQREQTIVGRHGGFAEAVRAQASWTFPLPDALDPLKAGPLFCGGATVFTPFAEFGIEPTGRVGVIGIGGLGHLAIQFARHWGCEVTAFTSSGSKAAEARELGAHHVVDSRDSAQLEEVVGSFDLIISTVNVSLDWMGYLNALAPKGRLHLVGAALEPVPVPAFGLIAGQKTVSGSPMASPRNVIAMLEFCARHGIAPVTEVFPMSRVNEAIDHLRAGKARYRVVLENDS